jgi:exodeoxyribonuclease VII large subunit
VDNSKDRALSVTEFTNSVKETLEQSMGKVWVKGEISNYSCPASGHVYFTLKDDTNQVKIAFFHGRSRKISSELKDGKEIIVFGRISIYGKRSEYQIIAEEVEVLGTGDLLVEFEKLKKKLADLGLFDASKKRIIPEFPRHIGIITSPTGAVIRDIINIITRRYNAVELLIYPVMVQGDEAPGQLMEGLKYFNSRDDIDVIILARGGGSIEDLWAFNDEKLAYAISASRVPVISAVGHEVDFTIADFAADLRAPTPSAAAELVVPDAGELLQGLKASAARLVNGLSGMVKGYEERLERAAKSYGFKKPFELFNEYMQRLDDGAVGLAKHLTGFFDAKAERVQVLKEKLGLINPLNVLKKGYSVVYDTDGGIIKDAARLRVGQEISVALYKGKLGAEVKKVSKQTRNPERGTRN